MSGTLPPADDWVERRGAGRWLAMWAAMLLLLVVIGGATRLTESGLSITEWKPLTGVVPPVGEAAWADEFAKYQQIPEYRLINAGMSLAAFKRIYLWEYAHRLWARIVGLAFAGPFLWFAVRGRLGARLTRRLFALLMLMALQGAMGWYMVKSGLSVRTDVSQYRLAAHLALALVIYAAAVWTAADLLAQPDGGPPLGAAPHTLRRWVAAFVGLVFATAIAGAFVAGLDAGKAFNTFPLMAGRLVPTGYWALSPWWTNPFENLIAVQFDHRVLGIATLLAAVGVWLRSRGGALVRVRRRAARLLAIVGVQVVLGITTLLLRVPVPVAVLHQAGAVLVLTAALLLLHAFREPDPEASGVGRSPEAGRPSASPAR